MNAAIIAKLGLDRGEFKNGLKAAVGDARKGGKEIQEGLQLERENKAERNIVGLTTELVKAESAAEAVGAALGRLPDIFQSSLLVGAVGGIGAALVSNLVKSEEAFDSARSAAAKFGEEIQNTIRFGTAGELDQGFARSTGEIQKLNVELEKTGSLWQIVLNGLKFGMGDSIGEKRLAIEQDIAKAQAAQTALGDQRLKKESEIVEVAKLRAAGLNEEADKLERQQKLTADLNTIAQQYSGTLGERLKALKIEEYSLGEQARMAKEFAAEQETAIKTRIEMAERQNKAEEEFNARVEQLIAEEDKVRATNLEKRLAAEKALAQVGESAQEKQLRLLREYAELEQKVYEATMTGAKDVDDLKSKMLEVQKDLAEDALKLNKEILAEEEKRVDANARIAAKQAEANAQLAQQRKESAQLSLGDLAAGPMGGKPVVRGRTRPTADGGQAVEQNRSAGGAARQAERELERAEKRAQRGDLEGAMRAKDRAENLKKGINTLKDSEKELQNALKGALDDSKVLKDIEKNTGKLGKML